MDDTDRKIVALLRQDARRSFQDIGSHVALSAPAVKRRVDIIHPVAAQPHPKPQRTDVGGGERAIRQSRVDPVDRLDRQRGVGQRQHQREPGQQRDADENDSDQRHPAIVSPRPYHAIALSAIAISPR